MAKDMRATWPDDSKQTLTLLAKDKLALAAIKRDIRWVAGALGGMTGGQMG